MKSNSIRVYGQYSAMSGQIELYISRRQGDRFYSASAVVMEEVEEGLSLVPAVRIDEPAAKSLMDDLWNAGVRPSNLKHSKEIMDSLNNHIDDFRKIIFNQLKIK